MTVQTTAAMTDHGVVRFDIFIATIA